MQDLISIIKCGAHVDFGARAGDSKYLVRARPHDSRVDCGSRHRQFYLDFSRVAELVEVVCGASSDHAVIVEEGDVDALVGDVEDGHSV